MEITAILNRKGGTGKTTTAINLSYELAQLGLNILLIDLDSQGNTTYSLGLTDKNGSVSDIIQAKNAMHAMRVIHVIRVSMAGFDVLPSSPSLADVELGLIGKIGREGILKDRLKEIKGYDYIVIDCPPSLSILTVNALTYANSVIIPLQMEVLSMQGLTQILNTIKEVKSMLNSKLEVKGILPTMFDIRRNLTHEILAEVKKNTKEKVFKSVIRECVKISESPSFAQPVGSYAPQSNGAIDYKNFAKEFIKGV